MSQIEKLIEYIQNNKRAVTFKDVEKLLKELGYKKGTKGKTSGSRIVFINTETGTKILLYKPHKRKELLEYQVKQILDLLEQEGLL